MKLSELKLLVYKALCVSITKQVKEIYPHLDLRAKKNWEQIYRGCLGRDFDKETEQAMKPKSVQVNEINGKVKNPEMRDSRGLTASQLATAVFAANQEREFLIGPSGEEGRFNLFEDGYAGIQLKNATDLEIIDYADQNCTEGRRSVGHMSIPEVRMTGAQLNDAILSTRASRSYLTGPSGAPERFSLFEEGRSAPHLLDAAPDEIIRYVTQNS